MIDPVPHGALLLSSSQAGAAEKGFVDLGREGSPLSSLTVSANGLVDSEKVFVEVGGEGLPLSSASSSTAKGLLDFNRDDC